MNVALGIYTVFMLILGALILFFLGTSIYGLYLAFSASIILGILVLLIEPLPLIIGLAKLLTGIDIAQKIVEWFTNL